MRRSEVAVTLLSENNPENGSIEWLVGTHDIRIRPLIPFHSSVCEFFDVFSKVLRAERQASQFSDLMTFAFWCRKSHIQKLKTEYEKDRNRLGLGLAFHIAPSNVPLNFAYSFAFGLLSGNANLVRVPSRNFEQVDLFCHIISQVFKEESFSHLAAMNAFVRYPANDRVTEAFSTRARARLIWGGDETIKTIRRFPLSEGGIDLSFRDRVSICVLNAEKISSLSVEARSHLAQLFYNDSYFMNQNACSSPSLVVWTGERNSEAKEIFWESIHEVAKKNYVMEPIQAVDKLTDLCLDSIDIRDAKIRRHGNILYRLETPKLLPKLEDCKRRFGYFMEYHATDLADLIPILQSKCQTMTYFGVKKEHLLNLVVDNHLTGVDRIVPVGSAFNMELVWDGFDLIRQLSRIIDVT